MYHVFRWVTAPFLAYREISIVPIKKYLLRLLIKLPNKTKGAIHLKGERGWIICIPFMQSVLIQALKQLWDSNHDSSVAMTQLFMCAKNHFDWLNNFGNMRPNPKGNLFLLNCLHWNGIQRSKHWNYLDICLSIRCSHLICNNLMTLKGSLLSRSEHTFNMAWNRCPIV